MFLWEKASNTMVYVQNSSPHMILGDKALEDAFSGVKLEIGLVDLQFSILHSYNYGEEDEDGTFRIEGYICGVQ
jgi:hypothetical protein